MQSIEREFDQLPGAKSVTPDEYLRQLEHNVELGRQLLSRQEAEIRSLKLKLRAADIRLVANRLILKHTANRLAAKSQTLEILRGRCARYVFALAAQAERLASLEAQLIGAGRVVRSLGRIFKPFKRNH